MKLWLLKAYQEHKAWKPWYDKAFGFVVAARDELEARDIAAQNCGDEGPAPWLDHKASTCVELHAEDRATPGIIIQDLRAA